MNNTRDLHELLDDENHNIEVSSDNGPSLFSNKESVLQHVEGDEIDTSELQCMHKQIQEIFNSQEKTNT